MNNIFQAWPKIPRLENERFQISEKIDGTNGCIIITLHNQMGNKNCIYTDYIYDVYAQSRSKLITPENDNFVFAKWVKENAVQLINDLGVGYHYGEWWGQGINRGYGLDHKRFSLFNLRKQSSICYNVPVISMQEGRFDMESLNIDVEYLKKNGSFAAPEYMKPEGLVIYAEKAKCYWKVIIDK
jgi:hypothetical protein